MNQNDTGKKWAEFCAYLKLRFMNQNDTWKNWAAFCAYLKLRL